MTAGERRTCRDCGIEGTAGVEFYPSQKGRCRDCQKRRNRDAKRARRMRERVNEVARAAVAPRMTRRVVAHATHLFDDVAGEHICIGCYCAPHDGLARDFCSGLSLMTPGDPAYRRLRDHILLVNGGTTRKPIGEDPIAALSRREAIDTWHQVHEGDTTTDEVAKRFGCTRRAVHRAWKRHGLTEAA